MLTVAAFNADGTFKIINQWGEDWGQHGLATAKESFITSPTMGDVIVVTVAPTSRTFSNKKPGVPVLPEVLQ